MKRESRSPEQRYRHKLNMLEPGSRMLACVSVLLAVGMLLWWTGLRRAAWVAFGLGGAVFAALWILIAIELHQDRVLNDLAQEEMKRKGPQA